MANFISNNINKPTVEELTTFTNYNTLFFNKDEDILIEVKNDDNYYYTHKIKLKDLKNL